MATGVLYLGVKRPQPEVNYSSPSRAEVKNEWNSTSKDCRCRHGVDRATSPLTFLDIAQRKYLSVQHRDKLLNAVWLHFVLTTVRNTQAYYVSIMASCHVIPQPIYACGKNCLIIL